MNNQDTQNRQPSPNPTPEDMHDFQRLADTEMVGMRTDINGLLSNGNTADVASPSPIESATDTVEENPDRATRRRRLVKGVGGIVAAASMIPVGQALFSQADKDYRIENPKTPPTTEIADSPVASELPSPEDTVVDLSGK